MTGSKTNYCCSMNPTCARQVCEPFRREMYKSCQPIHHNCHRSEAYGNICVSIVLLSDIDTFDSLNVVQTRKNTNCMEKGIIEWENIAIEMINRNQPGNVQSCISVRCWFEHVAEQFSSWKVVDIFRIRWYLFIVYLLVLPFTSQNVTAHTQSHKSIPEHTHKLPKLAAYPLH